MPIAVVAPATVISYLPNPRIQMAWTVANQGIGAATGSWYDRVWFSTNGVLDPNSMDMGDFYVTKLSRRGQLFADQHDDTADDRQRNLHPIRAGKRQ